MPPPKIQLLICGHDFDGTGGVAAFVGGDVHHLGHVRVGELAGIGGDHDADAVLPHEGHAVGVPLGGDQILDLGLGQGVGGQDLDALGGLVGHGLVSSGLLRRLLQKGDGVVPGLLPGQSGGGEVVAAGVDRRLVHGALGHIHRTFRNCRR